MEISSILCSLLISSYFPVEVAADGKGKSSKIIHKKGVAAGSGRKALNDISNKSSILHQEVPIRKKERAKEEIDVAGERFLHDHDKCIEAQRLPVLASYLDLVLPGHGKLLNVEDKIACNLRITKSASGYCFCGIYDQNCCLCDSYYYV